MATDGDDAFLDTYLAELDYLRVAGQDFAAKHHHVAHQLEMGLNGSVRDPQIERLIESFAFLTARVRRDIESNIPEIPTALLSVLYPHLTAPVPSAAIAQFKADPAKCRSPEGFEISKGTPLFAVSQDGHDFPFRTCYPITLLPLEVEQVELLPPTAYDFVSRAETSAILRLRVKCTAKGGLADIRPHTLRFFINADRGRAAQLAELVYALTRKAVVVSPATDTPVPSPVRILPVGFAPDEDVLPHPPTAHRGYRLLQEFFIFPEKYQFFDVTGLKTPAEGKHFDLLFLLDEEPQPNLVLSRDCFQLGCVPVVNLFPRTSEPIRLDHAHSEYPLVPDARREDITEVHTILKVSATVASGDDGKVIHPYYSYNHDMTTRGPQAFWTARRGPARRKGLTGSDIWLSFKDLELNPRLPADRVVYAHTLCTSRGVAELIPAHTTLHIERDVPKESIILLTRPTAQRDPPARGQSAWELVSHLSVNQLSLAGGQDGLEALKEILRLYAGQHSPADRQMIETLLDMKTRRVTRRIGADAWRGFCRGHEITLTVDGRPESGQGPFLFTAVLSRFFALYASIASFTQLVVKSHQPERKWITWDAMSGEQFLL